MVDEQCRPWVFVLTPGNTADCVMAEECVSLIPGVKQLLADKGYDTDAIRAFLKKRGIKPVIPGKSNRKKKIRHDKKVYKGRNVVERCFCRLKDFRRIATRYDVSIRCRPRVIDNKFRLRQLGLRCYGLSSSTAAVPRADLPDGRRSARGRRRARPGDRCRSFLR